MPGILGKKIGMSRIFTDSGRVIPVTVIESTGNIVTQVRTQEKDGYAAVVLGFLPMKNPTKTKKFYHLKEFRVNGDENYLENGKEVTLESFKDMKTVTVSGTSIGKGFQGVVKRYGFRGGRASHGAHGFLRAPGSIGECASPAEVMKGRKMAGRMGNARVTLKNRSVVVVHPEKNIILVKGSVPGKQNAILELKF